MTLQIRKHRTGGYLVDIHIETPDGRRIRDRKVLHEGKGAVAAWANKRHAFLLGGGEPDAGTSAQAPTLAEFAPRFLAHCAALQQKASGVASKGAILTTYLIPILGSLPLNQITSARVAELLGDLNRPRGLSSGTGNAPYRLSPKTINNILCVLSKALKTARQWGELAELPAIPLLKYQRPEMEFYDFGDLDRLLSRARPHERVLILLGAEAGLRAGEITALEWPDVDLSRRLINVQRSEWRGEVGTPKSGKSRRIPLTSRLAAALEAQQAATRLTDPAGRARVLQGVASGVAAQRTLQKWMQSAQRGAGMVPTGKLHILRHTFCSHLAMRGAPAMAIKELAGHADLSTTQRYMHLSPAAKDAAIALLEAA